MLARHELKTDSKVFEAVLQRKKLFEIRYNDRNYQVGDELLLRETTYPAGKPWAYSGRQIIVEVTYIIKGPVGGLVGGWAILSIKPIEDKRMAGVMPENERLRHTLEIIRTDSLTAMMCETMQRSIGDNIVKMVDEVLGDCNKGRV